jgi:hypothetical protein
VAGVTDEDDFSVRLESRVQRRAGVLNLRQNFSAKEYTNVA